jgi:predicted dehydrogenase
MSVEGPKRFAVIGVGHLGRYHAEKYAGIADVELVAVVDTDGARAREIAKKHGCEALEDPRRWRITGRSRAESTRPASWSPRWRTTAWRRTCWRRGSTS